MELTNVKYLERGLRMSGDKLNADLVRDMDAELANIRAENVRLREALVATTKALRSSAGYEERTNAERQAKEALK